jgi:hypothetical protein
MQKYSMSNKASIMSVLTLIISLVVIGLVSTGCGGGGGPASYTLIGTAVSPSNPATPDAGYAVTDGLTSTTTSGAGTFSLVVPSSIVGVPSPSVTLVFHDPNGNLVGTETVAITSGEISGSTINLGDVQVGPPTSPI